MSAGERERSIVVGLSEGERIRVLVIERILSAPDSQSYRQRQREGAKSLGISERSLRRLLQRWREDGLSGVVRQPHRDKGERQTSEDWQRYIVETWREGNREGRRLSPAQVFLRVRSRAEEQGEASYPSRSTVYRILRPEIEKKRRQPLGSFSASQSTQSADLSRPALAWPRRSAVLAPGSMRSRILRQG